MNRPTTDSPAYDAAMNALHDASSDGHAWDIAWAPESIRTKLHEALCILGQRILDEWSAHDALVEACQKSIALIELKYPATVAEAVSRWVVGDEVRGDVATTYMALRAALDAAKGAKRT